MLSNKVPVEVVNIIIGTKNGKIITNWIILFLLSWTENNDDSIEIKVKLGVASNKLITRVNNSFNVIEENNSKLYRWLSYTLTLFKFLWSNIGFNITHTFLCICIYG